MRIIVSHLAAFFAENTFKFRLPFQTATLVLVPLNSIINSVYLLHSFVGPLAEKTTSLINLFT